jgi:hypothetical protein
MKDVILVKCHGIRIVPKHSHFLARWFLGLIFGPEDVGDTILRNFDSYIDYRALYTKIVDLYNWHSVYFMRGKNCTIVH